MPRGRLGRRERSPEAGLPARSPLAVSLAALVAIVFLSPSVAAAALPPPVQVADIHRGPQSAGTDHPYFASDFEPFAGRVYFGAEDGIHGWELWASDGTAEGTALVADICPGACSSGPLSLTAIGDRLFFAADDGSHGSELWSTDGTDAGTVLVADLNPGLEPSRPSGFIAFDHRFFFTARSDGGLRSDLWISDGTAAGTMQLLGDQPGLAPVSPVPMTVLGGRLLFAASDPDHGRELWVSDGTGGGTGLLHDFRPGPDSSLTLDHPFYPGFGKFAVRDGELYLPVNSPGFPSQLWVTDATASSLRQLTEFDSGDQGVGFTGLEACGDLVFFRAGDVGRGSELWASDGTVEGTGPVADANPGPEGSGPWEIVCSGGSLFYFAFDPDHGHELWTSDGTEQGTHLVHDIRPGPEGSLFTRAALAASEGRVFFFADDGVSGLEPWISDGTPERTERLRDIHAGPTWSMMPWIPLVEERWETLAGEWYFRASDGESGAELWVSDGTAGGTRSIEINRQSSAFGLLSVDSRVALAGARPWAFFDGALLFAADPGSTGPELWRSDGSAAGTRQVAELAPGLPPWQATPDGMVAAAKGVVLAGHREECCGFRLWATDGTTEGTVEVTAVDGHPVPLDAARLGERTFFTAAAGLWNTDGTVGGTRLGPVVDVGAGVERLEGWIYYGAGQSHTFPAASELGRTDGTVFEVVTEIVPGTAGAQPRDLLAVGDTLFFSADDGITGREIWASDGTEAGTRRVLDVLPGPAASIQQSNDWTPFGQQTAAGAAGRLFFRAEDGVHGEELWVSDGTAAGTFLLTDLFPGPRGADVRWLAGTSSGAFFVADDGVHGRELWFSDGTSAGTELFSDLVPGAGSSLPLDLLPSGDRVYFSAHTGARGRELWVADAITRSLSPVPEIAPGPRPSSPMGLFADDGWLWFIANDGTTGFELWRLPLGAEIFADGFESGDTAAWSAIQP